MKVIYLVSLMLFSTQVEACVEFMPNWNSGEQWIDGSESIYHGIVVSISLSDEEIYNRETDPLFNMTSYSDKHITLKVFETLKGESNKALNVVLRRCFGGITHFGETALLFKVKVKDIWHIKANKQNSLASDVLQKLSTIEHVSDIQP